ncbi:MAG: DUF1846 family protein [Nanoarchaeota archaeon]|nr:DUF1846 family protein [Nanoarchaeota archaeon]
MEKGFDTDKYLQVQSQEILSRVKNYEKLYLEFGGKICYDHHAARVLPGYGSNTKIKILQMIKDKSEIIFCVSAKDIENGRIRGDFGLTYDAVTLRTINDLRGFGLDVSAVVVNRFSGEEKSLKFKKYLENLGIDVYLQKEIKGYPADIDKIVSAEGYGQNPYVKTTKPIVVVTGAGPGSGKMAFCLSQMYFENTQNLKSGFAKFETFPIWNLPLEHPINVAYEAATADLEDVNMVDPFHLEAYGITAINYNRDIENFPILKKILEKIGQSVYKSPTEMGVSKAKEGIINDVLVEEAAKQEIIRRCFRYKKENVLGITGKKVVDRAEKLMQKLNLKEDFRRVVGDARRAAQDAEMRGKGNKGFFCGSAIEIDGKVFTGKNSKLLHSESACIINAVKFLANLPDEIHVFPEHLIQNLRDFKKSLDTNSNPSLDVGEVLIALAISSSNNPVAMECLNKIHLLKNCEMHTTHLPAKGDEAGLRDLGINFTTDAEMGPSIYINQ